MQLDFIGGGLSNCITSFNGSYGILYGAFANFIGGGYANLSCGAYGLSGIFGGRNNTLSGPGENFILGNCNLGVTFATSVAVADVLSKTSGKFSIRHPDPTKTATHSLEHSFVESPTAGDNLYRFEVATENCEATVSLPSYYKFLNCNDQVWITPKDHMGVAYGTVNNDQTEINITSNCDSSYYVLLIGTRKDEKAQIYWPGVEIDRIICNSY